MLPVIMNSTSLGILPVAKVSSELFYFGMNGKMISKGILSSKGLVTLVAFKGSRCITMLFCFSVG